MNINVIKKIAEELFEATMTTWSVNDVIPAKASGATKQSGKGKGGQEVKEIGKPLEPLEPLEPPHGDFSAEGSGDKGVGQGELQSGDDANKTADADGSGTSGTTYGEGQLIDNHDFNESGDNTGKSIIKKVYQESQAEYRRIAARKGAEGTEAGGFMDSIKDFIKADFDLSSILSRIGTFKRKLSEKVKKSSSYQTAIFNPVTQQGNIVSKGRLKQKQKNINSAIMFVAIDTSGSISADEFRVALGYLNTIAKQFQKQAHGIDGEVYLIQWDTQVHPPLDKWTYINELKPTKDLSDKEKEQLKLKGGGGTDVQAVFNYLDKNFVKTIDGRDYFVFGDKLPALTGKEEDKNIETDIRQALKPASKDYKEPSWKKDAGTEEQGRVNVNEGGFSNVPFLLFYTDGYFSPPNINSSKLYANNPGNILYIVTDRGGVKNVRPKNYIIHELHK